MSVLKLSRPFSISAAVAVIACIESSAALAAPDSGAGAYEVYVQKTPGAAWEGGVHASSLAGWTERRCSQHLIRDDPSRFIHAVRTVHVNTSVKRTYLCDRATGKPLLQAAE